MWIIVDSKSGQQVGKPYSHHSRAIKRRDKLDLIYGACRYRVVRLGLE